MPSPSTHLRAPLLWILIPFSTGLVAAKLWPAPASGVSWLIALAAVLALGAIASGFRRGKRGFASWAICVSGAAGLAGFAMLHLRHPHLHSVDQRPPREITLTVQVFHVFPIAPKARSLTGLAEVVATSEGEHALLGRHVYFSAVRRISVAPQPSGRYVMTGVIEPLAKNARGDGFEVYLDNLGISHRLIRAHISKQTQPPTRFRAFCTLARDRLEKILSHGIEAHPQTRSLYLAILLGEKAVLSPEQENAFMRSGTFHIFSISGLHVGVISLALHGLLQFLRVPRRIAVALNLTLLWLYVQITGGSSPAERSFLMIAFLLAAQVFRLPGKGLAALVAAALTTLLLDPLQLFNTGFQMSYTVVIALVVMGVPLAEKWLEQWQPFSFLPKQNWNWRQRGVEWFGRYLLPTIAASWVAFLASAPAGIGYFKMLSPGSLVANLVIIPLSSLAMIAGFISLLTGLLGLVSLSVLFNSAATVTLIVTEWLVRHGTAVRGVYFDADFKAPWLTPASLVAMIGIMLLCLAGGWQRRYGGYWPPVVMLVLIVIFSVKFGSS
ncbi:ComEC/Rec2 family competence protein [Oleiharenicola lentus]|uniref:ComEC/Rec2 family competence protein n=1 Tax=Oleiharenicola lentus TaxID=2508720 RepID=UPI003F681B4B